MRRLVLCALLACGGNKPATPAAECSADDDCPTGSTCQSGSCSELCATDAQCPSGEQCNGGRCTGSTCGDSKLEGDEQCDDGAANGEDAACTSLCVSNICGDGFVEAGVEDCDDANDDDDDGCIACVAAFCGDGFMEAGVEACDGGADCSELCTLWSCGDGQEQPGEACDDGNDVEGDGCDGNCTLTGCQNGVVTAGEGCDDGNAVNGDGCDENCRVTACRNGVVTGSEECDDGNLSDLDACLSTCVLADCVGGPDTDADGTPNRCDACPGFDDDDALVGDVDGDRLCGAADNCPSRFNPGQLDSDLDGRGDACELLDPSSYQQIDQGDAGGTTESGDQFGAALTTGFINDDAYADLLVGGPGEDGGAGALFVLYGSAAGLGSGVARKQNDAGGAIEAGDHFGYAVAAGDFDADGFDDVVGGAPGEDSDTGAVSVFYGSATGIPSVGTSFTASDFGCGNDEAGDDFGYALAAGDINHDGYDDLAIGGPGENGDTGVVCLVFGSAAGLASGAYYFQDRYGATGDLAAEAGDRFGAALTLGHFADADHADLAVGGPGEDVGGSAGNGEGMVTVYFGKSGGDVTDAFSGTPETVLQTEAGAASEADDRFGSVLAAGDLVGDAFDELVVGAPGEDLAGQKTGVIFVFAGGSTTITDGDYFAEGDDVTGANDESGDLFGSALATGDFDGNGRADLAAGGPGEDYLGSGAGAGMMAVFAADSVLADLAGKAWVQDDLGATSEAGDLFGAALAAGDFNGDGAADIAIGAPGEAPFVDPAGGFLFVVYGNGGQLRLTHGPILGAVTDRSIRVWVRSNQETTYALAYAPSAGGPETVIEAGALGVGSDLTGVAELQGLSPATAYDYRVLLGPGHTETATGSFRTLPQTGAPGTFTFAFGADIHRAYRPFVIFDEITAAHPDFMLSVGDNVYADNAPDTRAGFEDYYKVNFGDAALRGCWAQVPVFLMWDDHEIANDWSGGVTGRYVNARAAADEYLFAPSPAPLRPGEVYYSFRAGEADFFVLDPRSHRSPNTMDDGPSKTMLGAQQLADLIDWLDRSPGKLKLIVSAVAFNDWTTTGDDAWNGKTAAGGPAPHGAFRTERDVILNHIAQQHIEGVVLLAGDQHFAGIYHLLSAPAPLWELMPTPLAVSNRPALDVPLSPEVRYQDDTKLLYGHFTVDTTVTPAVLTVEYRSQTGALLCHVEIDAAGAGLDTTCP